MRSWIWTLLLLAGAVGLAVVLRDHGGNVLIVAQPWRIELSLTLAVVLALVGFLALHWLLRGLYWLGDSPGRLRAWRGRRARRRDVELLERGWIHVLEGRYVQAEKDLSNLVARTRSNDRKVLAGLSAARSLHLLGEYRRRDDMLTLAAAGATKDARLRQAVDTVRAEMLLDQGLAGEALGLLKPWQGGHSRFLHGTRLLLRAQRQLGDADQVYALTRLLARKNAIDSAQARQFITEAVIHRLAKVDEAAFKTLWSDLTAEERLDPDIALAAAQARQRLGHDEAATKILESALAHQLDDRLLRLYSHCTPEQAPQRLTHAERWLKKAPDHPGLLAALGQICLVSRLWGQGERYLNRSLALREDAHIHALLGNLDDALGRPADALKHWRKACEVADAVVPGVRRLLPAADTAGDPSPGLQPAEPNRAEPVPRGVSGVYLEGTEASGRSGRSEARAADPVAAATVPASDDDEYFDTAPLPGVDMSQTSDRSSGRDPSR